MSNNCRTYPENMWAFALYQDKFKRIPRKLKKLFKKSSNESVRMQMCIYLRDKEGRKHGSVQTKD